ncbi:TPA: glycosyltransferase [Streptococcus suis]
MPSFHESFGLVYAEAMSQGMPVIYTRGQGFDGQFEEGVVGFSVDCIDEVEISNKIISIVKGFKFLSISFN